MKESSDRPEFSPDPEKKGCNYYPEPPILKVEELRMPEEKTEEVLTPYGVYHLGELIQEINDILDMRDRLASLKLNDIKKLLKEVEHLKTRDTREIAEQAGTVLRNLEEKKDIFYDYSDERKIKDLVTRWDERIKETLKRTKTVQASPKQIDVGVLRKGVAGFLSKEEQEFLTERERRDLQEACRTALVGCPTAAVMLSLRVTESLLVRWHEALTGKETKKRPWGEVLEKIGAQFKERKPEIGFMEFLRDERNKVMHPDKIPDQGEAETTLQMVTSKVIPILKEAIEKEQKKKV